MADVIRLAPSFLVFTALFLNNILSGNPGFIIYHQCSLPYVSLSALMNPIQKTFNGKRLKTKVLLRPRRSYSAGNFLHLFVLFLLISNDIERNPGPSGGSVVLKSCTFNARSIVNKRIELQAVANTRELELIAITETWLNCNILDNEILSSEYNIHRRDRLRRGGGVLLAVKNGIRCQRRFDLETDCEILWCELNSNPGLSYFVGVFYRPPDTDLNYLTELTNSLEKLPPSCKILLLGDFNLPNIEWTLVSPLQQDSLSDYFCDYIVNYFGLSQLVKTPTRGNALLDLVLTNTPENISSIDIDCGLGNSDHNIIFFGFNAYISRPRQAPKIVYYYKNANWTNFRSDLSNSPWDTVFLNGTLYSYISQMWHKWKELFFAAVYNNIKM